MKKKIFSGIQPSGTLHIGNYLGAVKQWVDLSSQFEESIYCVVDLHAITLPQPPKELKAKILEVAAMYIACGVDPEKSSIFVQSTRPEHTELAWILNCIAGMGELYRMTQFKDKTAGRTTDSVGVGLFDYPVLMAADILLYNASHVPVGDDQKQHVELTRNLAQRFNRKFGQTFTVPEAVIKKETARIMGLDDPTKKMSKSASSPYNYIAMTDSKDVIFNKIKRAVTDSGSEIKAGADKPAITNLLNIYSEMSGKSVAEIEKMFSGKGYGDFKQDLAELIVNYLEPIQEKYDKLIKDRTYLSKVLHNGSKKVESSATEMINLVKEKVGLGI
jgi:tryptophanyl-tRNA synthetase